MGKEFRLVDFQGNKKGAPVRHGSDPNVYQQMIGSRRCGVYKHTHTHTHTHTHIHIHNGILLSHKKYILPFLATWMDLKDIMLSEISQTKKLTI